MKRENDSPGVTVPGFAFWLEAKKCNMRSVRLLLDVIASHAIHSAAVIGGDLGS